MVFWSKNIAKCKDEVLFNDSVNQAVQEQVNVIQRFFVFFLLIAFCATTLTLSWFFRQSSNPYLQEVLSISGDRSKGELIFKVNCAACHGLQANGIVGPSLQNVPKRKSKKGLVEQVISGKTPPMPKFQPSPQEMADLLVYLEYL